MASKFLRKQKWWIKLRHPITGSIIRESLETHDEVRAELLRASIELQARLLEPRFNSIEIPTSIRERLGLMEARAFADNVQAASHQATSTLQSNGAAPPHVQQQVARHNASVDEAVRVYFKFIASENAPPHIANKLSMLRRFLGDQRVDRICPPPASKRSTKARATTPAPKAPFFKGNDLQEITPALVQDFIEGIGVGRKTMRHYRQFFHHLFEVCLKFDLYHPTNWHRPNPIAALPAYGTRNQRIVFLTQEQIQEQLNVLVPHPALRMGVAIMIHAGLRRSETLWLTRDAVSKDLSFLSVVNRVDEGTDVESSLKTGERTVTILPPLRKELRKYLKTLDSSWLIPNRVGNRWTANNFARRLRVANEAASLKWNCLAFRHTFATQRAAEGWPLFRIAKEMGNSVAVVEQYYAGFIRPA
jgi:integrase